MEKIVQKQQNFCDESSMRQVSEEYFSNLENGSYKKLQEIMCFIKAMYVFSNLEWFKDVCPLMSIQYRTGSLDQFSKAEQRNKIHQEQKKEKIVTCIENLKQLLEQLSLITLQLKMTLYENELYS